MKPLIKKRGLFLWKCSGRGSSRLGTSPALAYAKWESSLTIRRHRDKQEPRPASAEVIAETANRAGATIKILIAAMSIAFVIVAAIDTFGAPS